MSISFPKPNIEPSPGEPLDEKRLREVFKDIQRDREVLRKVVAGEGEFLQLVSSLLGAKLGFGESSVTFSGAKKSNEPTVAHGLGVKPVFVTAFLEAAGGSETQVTFRAVERGTTTFKIYANASVNVTATLTFLWIAIG